jgi:serine O-acetyltransferase
VIPAHENAPEAKLSFWQVVKADLAATTHENYRTYYSPVHFWLRAAAKFITSPAVRVVFLYRISHLLAKHRMLPLALLLRQWGINSSGAELNPLATVGPGLYLPHSIGAGFGPWVTIGANCTLQAGAAIGPQPFAGDRGERKYTVLGDGVYVGLHAVIIGGVTVGDGAVIGANALVVRDVEPYAVISASPGRVVGSRSVGDTHTDA